MCEHCGCRGVEPIAELMDEHLALLDLGGSVRRALSSGDRRTAVEHQTFDEAIAALDPQTDDFEARVSWLLDELDEHVERENLGIFPVSVVTLGATGWDTVNRAHAAAPSFLRDAASAWSRRVSVRERRPDWPATTRSN